MKGAQTLVHVNICTQVTPIHTPQAPPCKLAPEGLELRPAYPILRPFGGGIGGKGNGPPETILPVCQDGVPLIGNQRNFRPRFGGTSDITPQDGEAIGSKAANRLAVHGQLRLEGMLDDGGFKNHRRFLHENLW